MLKGGKRLSWRPHKEHGLHNCPRRKKHHKARIGRGDKRESSHTTSDNQGNAEKKAERKRPACARVIGTKQTHRPPFRSHPLRETAFYAFILNKHFVNVSLISARRGKKNLELRELTKNRGFFQHFFQPSVFQLLTSPLPPVGLFQKVLGGCSCLTPMLPTLFRTEHASLKSHLHQSTAFERLLKEFRCSRARGGGGIGWAPAGSVSGFSTWAM